MERLPAMKLHALKACTLNGDTSKLDGHVLEDYSDILRQGADLKEAQKIVCTY